MDRNVQKNGLINFVILLVSAVAGLIVAQYNHVMSAQVVCMFLGLGVLMAGVSWFQMRLEEQERLEKMEFDEVTKGSGSSQLFNTQEAEAFPARRSRELFETYFVRGFTVLLLLLQAGGAWWMWSKLKGPEDVGLRQPLMSMALLGMFALVLFLIGKFSTGLARLENQRLLRPGANFLLLGAYFLGLNVVAIATVEAGFPRADLFLAYALCVVLGLLAVETAFSLLLEIYRPRIKGQVEMVLYESRLVGLLGHPEGLFTTAAHALDYQFGFKVSETWFYQFLKRALGWIILGQVSILLLSTSLVFIDSGEQALLERFGQPVAGHEILQPGLHFKYPWPIDKVYRHRTDRIQSFHVGFEHEEEEEEEESTLLWTVAHYQQEFHLLVASRSQLVSTNAAGSKKNPPVNLLSLGLPVQYQISDLKAWVYNYENAGSLLRDMATREVVKFLSSADMQELMSSGRFPAAEELRQRIQAGVDELGLGVKIVFVGLQDIHPPVQVASAYEKVVSARQNKEADILSARAYAVSTNGQARSRALQIGRQAEGERRRLEVMALARAALFTNQIPAYEASPKVYALRAYLEALAEGSSGARKIIMGTTNSQDVFTLNLEEKIRSDLLDVGVPGSGQ